MLQRDLKLFFKCLAGAGILLVILGAVLTAAAGIMSRNAADGGIINVAVVDNEDSVMSRILINSVKNSEYLSGMLSAERMDEGEAMDALASGAYTAVILLPEGFLSDIMSGREASGKVYLSDAAASQSEIIASAVRFGERLLASGQYAIFAGQRLIRSHGLGGDYNSDFLTKVNLKLIDEAMYANQKYFTFETLSFDSTGVDTATYFALCYTTLLICLLSLFFIPLHKKDCTFAMLARLRSLGVGKLRFIAPKLLIMFAFRLIILAAIAVGISVLTPKNALFAIMGAAYITITTAALTICFRDGISANVVSAMAGMFLCGGFVPRQLLPDAVVFFSYLTPFGGAKALIEPIFGAPVNIPGIIAAAIYTALSLILISKRLDYVLSGRDVK